MTEKATGIVEELLVVELLIANVGLGLETADRLGEGTRRLVELLHEELSAPPIGTMSDDVHRRVTRALRGLDLPM